METFYWSSSVIILLGVMGFGLYRHYVYSKEPTLCFNYLAEILFEFLEAKRKYGFIEFYSDAYAIYWCSRFDSWVITYKDVTVCHLLRDPATTGHLLTVTDRYRTMQCFLQFQPFVLNALE